MLLPPFIIIFDIFYSLVYSHEVGQVGINFFFGWKWVEVHARAIDVCLSLCCYYAGEIIE